MVINIFFSENHINIIGLYHMGKYFVFPGYQNVEDEPQIRHLIYKALKIAEARIRKRILSEEDADELGRALKAINMISLKVKSARGRPTDLRELERIDVDIFDKINSLISIIMSKEYNGIISLVFELDKLINRRNNLFK